MIGWIMFSRDAVAKAEAALKSDELGVRDEVGFLGLHQAFADRFFPGTSVLHTRLRYALFVPWLMEHAEGNPAQLAKDELALTWQLHKGPDNKNGVIGGSILPRAPVQSPSMMYWSALTRWRIVLPRPDGVTSSRSEVLKRIAATHKYALGRHRQDDGEPAQDEDLSPFVKLPPPPDKFLKNGEMMDFNLKPGEAKFVRRQLIGVFRGGAQQSSAQSLLARLAEAGLPDGNIDWPWSRAVAKIADAEDRAALTVARQAAALAGIGRAVYAALVEEAKAGDGAPRTTIHREDLLRMVGQYREAACALDMAALKALVPALPDYLDTVLRDTQRWLNSGGVKITGLRDAYFRAEDKRKRTRARLANTVGGKHLRSEWSANDHPRAEPLHFRWGNVRRLLTDLRTR